MYCVYDDAAAVDHHRYICKCSIHIFIILLNLFKSTENGRRRFHRGANIDRKDSLDAFFNGNVCAYHVYLYHMRARTLHTCQKTGSATETASGKTRTLSTSHETGSITATRCRKKQGHAARVTERVPWRDHRVGKNKVLPHVCNTARHDAHVVSNCSEELWTLITRAYRVVQPVQWNALQLSRSITRCLTSGAVS